MIRVLVADDQTLVRAGFRAILEAQNDLEVVGEAEDGAKAVALAHELGPDVVLMDVRMPGVDGIEATRRLVRDGDGPRVLMLTTFDLDEYVYEAMKAGASGFLLKDAPRDQLVDAVRTVAAGDALLAPAIVRRLIEDFVRRPPPGARRPGQLDELTQRELEVLTLIARGLANSESLRRSSSARRRCARTSHTSSPSSSSATGSRPSCTPMRPGSCSRR